MSLAASRAVTPGLRLKQETSGHPVEEVHSARCKAALHHMRDVRDVDAPRSCICAYHHHTLPAPHAYMRPPSGMPTSRASIRELCIQQLQQKPSCTGKKCASFSASSN